MLLNTLPLLSDYSSHFLSLWFILLSWNSRETLYKFFPSFQFQLEYIPSVCLFPRIKNRFSITSIANTFRWPFIIINYRKLRKMFEFLSKVKWQVLTCYLRNLKNCVQNSELLIILNQVYRHNILNRRTWTKVNPSW